MAKREFTFPSTDGRTKIHAIEWVPEQKVKAVLQIAHGMVEYIDRYDEFATYLADRGVYVVGHDHLGHGQSVCSEGEYGYFPQPDGNKLVIGDIHKLRMMTEEKYMHVPYFMLGHSMGSFLLRQYLTMHSKGLAGAIIMGTGHQPLMILKAGQLVCKLTSAFKGWKYRSEFVNNLSFGSFNKKFEPAETSRDWVTSDTEKRSQYVQDPLCGFTFTVGGYYQMFEGMKVLDTKGSVDRIRKDIPIFFVAGADDPVGDFGKGVKKIYEKYKAAGIQDVSIKLYEKDRHEILNEKDRGQVYEDLYVWIVSKL